MATESMTAKTTELTWEATEGREGSSMTIMIGSGVGGLIIASILFYLGQWLGGIVVIVAAGALITTHRLAPRIQRVQISRSSVTVNAVEYPFSALKSFWLVENESIHMLYLEEAGRFGRLLHLPLGSTSTATVRSALAGKVTENPTGGEDLTTRLNHWLGL